MGTRRIVTEMCLRVRNRAGVLDETCRRSPRRDLGIIGMGLAAIVVVILSANGRAAALSNCGSPMTRERPFGGVCNASADSVEAPATNRLLNPPNVDGRRVPIAIALRILNISDIDEVTQRFQMVGYLVAQWRDPRLAFTPRAGWEKFRTYSADQVWRPHFDFVNGVVPHSASDTTIRAFPDGTMKYSERSSAELSNLFSLRTFPFDRQTLEILIHPTVAEDATVELSELGGGRSISAEPRVYSSLAQWRMQGMAASVEQIPGLADESVSEIRFTLSISRRFNFYIWKVFLPLLLMVILSWTVFWIDTSELSSQVTISVTTILTLIAFAFAIQANLPKVPYLTFIDVFFLVCYLFVFFTAIEITVVHRAGRAGHAARAQRLSCISRVALPIAFVAVDVLIVGWYFG
jgi:Neurotransmitter-gated ion-channel ligand binding domain/Neurotransmitter-gated ion-channel transmembrane region